MAVSIKNPETERLARDLASRTGVSITEAITVALLAIGRRCAALPDLDLRTAEEILGYDEIGLPR
jgi:antitoxin VapB